ncbi:rhomboid family intramembrane serine protease [Cellulosilyticum sp. I15G10I2]|uniref:rhomboid family intramembrane serine protease n=1 Tax=Cellulosilyticum sp. I15G10I2 TaxID=1892843 RepID=UPI00085CC997|nr:rhomboid family intramembrane serine protease [Cellulosilyticum sp. I15G10I2]
MNFLDKLQRKYGKYAINNLMLYILCGNAFVFLFYYLTGGRILYFLVFDFSAILRGEIWRLVSFLFIPNTFDMLWFIFSAFLYYSIGMQLENTWGTFKFNIYYFTGAILTMLASALFNSYGTTLYINLSLFLAYATLFPNVQFRIYFLIPVKVKYLAYLNVAFLLYQFFLGSLGTKSLIIISLLNYLLFFGIPLLKGRRTHTQRHFTKQKRELQKGSSAPIRVAFHKCHVCGKTEVTNPDMEFRYCSKCNGNFEYCMDHIKDHEHVN